MSLSFPSFDVNRQPKSGTISYHPDDEHIVERKDTKRSDPDYFTHLEPSASASDDDEKVTMDQSSGESKKQPASISVVKTYGPAAPTHAHAVTARDNLDGSLLDDEPRQEGSKVSETHVVSSQTIHHNSHNNRNTNSSYEKLLTPQTVYIPNLPKVINTVSVSVSDQNGKKLNLSLANVLAEKQQRQQADELAEKKQRRQKLFDSQNYDEFKDDEIEAALLQPFFLDVPKITDDNIARSSSSSISSSKSSNRNSTSPRRR